MDNRAALHSTIRSCSTYFSGQWPEQSSRLPNYDGPQTLMQGWEIGAFYSSGHVHGLRGHRGLMHDAWAQHSGACITARGKLAERRASWQPEDVHSATCGDGWELYVQGTCAKQVIYSRCRTSSEYRIFFSEWLGIQVVFFTPVSTLPIFSVVEDSEAGRPGLSKLSPSNI